MLDALIRFMSPQRAVRRQLARAQLSSLAKARAYFDGATQGNRANSWRVIGSDANAEVRLGGARLRDVARDMERNNSYAAHAKAVIISNTIGTGIIPSVEARAKRTRSKLEELMKEHFDTTSIDATGKTNLYGIQALALGCCIVSGEVLIRIRPRKVSDGFAMPFQLQVIEPDFIDTMKEGKLGNGNTVIQGIEYDPIGRVVNYWLYNEHPGSSSPSRIAFKQSAPVPADSIIHMYRVDRPGQGRGTSWFAPVIMRLRDFPEYLDAQLLRQKIAACFAAFVTVDGQDGTSISETETSASGLPLESFEPGMIERLRPGESVEFGSPPSVGEIDRYSTVTLHEIAAGLNISYEVFSGDYTAVNFSSGRMGWLEFERQINGWRNTMVEPQMLAPIGSVFLRYARVMGLLPATDMAKIKWTAPRRDMISPRDEVPYLLTQVRAGFMSRTEAIRRAGYDPETVEAEYVAENERADALKLVFDSDPRNRTASGNLVSAPGAANDNPSQDDQQPGDNQTVN